MTLFIYVNRQSLHPADYSENFQIIYVMVRPFSKSTKHKITEYRCNFFCLALGCLVFFLKYAYGLRVQMYMYHSSGFIF